MKKLFHFLKCWLITGEEDELEFEIVLEWYDLVGIGIIILGVLYYWVWR